MMVLLTLFGGTALLLYGIRESGEALQRVLGGRLRVLLIGLSKTRALAVVSGATITAMIQSSSATILMLIGFVSAALITFRQTLGVILGADIGTSVTVQLIAFNIADSSLLLVGVGCLISFVARRRVVKDGGQALLGFGLLFPGLKLILDGVAPLQSNALAAQILDALSGNLVLAVLVAAAASALIASSAATIGLTMALAHHGVLTLPGAVAIVLGANIGTCATALMASIGTTAEAKRVAAAHIAFKLLGVALIFPFIDPFTRLLLATSDNPARQVANAHTFFNIGMGLAFLPLAPVAARLIEAFVPDDPQGDNPFRTRYLDDRALDQPSLAVGQRTRESLRMADVVQGMLRDAITVFRTGNLELIE